MALRAQPNGPQVIWICRHANRIDFVDPTWKGIDPHLSDDGVVQARETGIRLRQEAIRHIFASPFLRAIQTAHLIAEVLDLRVMVEHGATEWLNPDWFSETPSYIPADERTQRFPRVDPDYVSVVVPRYPETAEEATMRAARAARMLADRYGSDILIVGHGHSVAGMARGLVGEDCTVSAGLCALVKVVRKPGRGVLEMAGDADHLSGRRNQGHSEHDLC